MSELEEKQVVCAAVEKEKEEKEKEKEEVPKKKDPVSVNDVFDLGKKSSDADINKEYASLKKLDNSSNFMSRNTTSFKNINGKTVAVDTFVYRKGLLEADYSYSAAIGLFNSVVNCILLVISNKLSKKYTENSLW